MTIHTSLLGGVPPTPPVNIHTVLFQRPELAALPDYVMHIDGMTGEKRTRSQFVKRLGAAANALAADTKDGGLALGTDEIVGIFSDNILDYPVLVHALLKLTIPFALMSSYSTAPELEHLINKSRVTRLFVYPPLLPLALQVAGTTGLSQERIYLLGGNKSTNGTLMVSLQDLIDRTKGAPEIAVRPASNDTLAYLLFSSGTTGPPKAAMISHGNLVSTLVQTLAMAALAGPPPPYFPIMLAFLPWYHGYGFVITLIRAMAVPCTNVILPRWDLDLAIDCIEKYKITSLPLIPSVIPQLVVSTKLQKADLSSLQMASFGAAHTPTALFNKLRLAFRRNVEKVEGYGLSETTLTVLFTPGPELQKRVKWNPAAKGILMPGLQARIVREDGNDAGFEESGELYVKGGNVFMGYYKDEEATKAALTADKWLRTGDTFKADKHGNFYFQDRAKETLKVSGVQVSPSEIEEVLLAHPQSLISEACVAGVPSKRSDGAKVPRAWIVLSEAGRRAGADQTVHNLDQWTKERLSRYKWLRGGIEVIDEIPKLSTGKMLKRVLIDRYNATAANSRL